MQRRALRTARSAFLDVNEGEGEEWVEALAVPSARAMDVEEEDDVRREHLPLEYHPPLRPAAEKEERRENDESDFSR